MTWRRKKPEGNVFTYAIDSMGIGWEDFLGRLQSRRTAKKRIAIEEACFLCGGHTWIDMENHAGHYCSDGTWMYACHCECGAFCWR